ncbi:hypothetical protein D3C81_2181370 [compost metagenome]
MQDPDQARKLGLIDALTLVDKQHQRRAGQLNGHAGLFQQGDGIVLNLTVAC